ncbi:MAG: lytic murein transglycosylase B [Gammaproteobacteria bacterium]|nr:lytic murein transglycosylase B [Gammaproteobacteria bacterium]
MRLMFLLGMTMLLLFGSAYADYTVRQDVKDYIAELVAEHGFAESELAELFAEVERKDSILEAIARPAERTLKWHEYRKIFLKEQRIAQGLEFWAENEPALLQAEATYGVPPEYVVAIIGVETRYGRITGSYRVVDALTTLGFDYPKRAKFFRRELTQFLLLAREEGANPRDLKGSYAGAMGYGQFIPSSYRAYAVDFDGDGRRDIWTNTTDAIGSVANYFSRHGWQNDGRVVMPVTVTGGDLDGVANKTLDLNHTVGELQDLGVQIDTDADDLTAATRASIYRMELEEGAEYWLGLKNFHVITRYNRSRLYALAVHQLGQAILSRHEQLAAAL